MINDEGLAWIRFNRPEALNAISIALVELLPAVQQLQAAPCLSTVVIAGSGHAFMAGGDLQASHGAPAMADRTARVMIDPLHAKRPGSPAIDPVKKSRAAKLNIYV